MGRKSWIVLPLPRNKIEFMHLSWMVLDGSHCQNPFIFGSFDDSKMPEPKLAISHVDRKPSTLNQQYSRPLKGTVNVILIFALPKFVVFSTLLFSLKSFVFRDKIPHFEGKTVLINSIGIMKTIKSTLRSSFIHLAISICKFIQS